jgi:HSP20 family protein
MLVRRVWPSRPAFESSWSDLDPLRREMLRMLGGLAGESWRGTAPGVFPPMNVTQDQDNFYVRAEVPGIRVSDLSISAMRNRVSISGKREIPVEQEKVSYHRKERAEGGFHRTMTLPTDVDADRVDATYADGILTLTLPKAEEAKPRHIAVRS